MDWVNTPLGPTKKNLKSLGGIWAEQYSVEILVESTPPHQLSSLLEPVRNRVNLADDCYCMKHSVRE